MNRLFYFNFSVFMITMISPLSHAYKGSFGCAGSAEHFSLGALSEFEDNTDHYYGFQCQLKPKYSTFLGNWFPALPKLIYSQSTREINSKIQDDYIQSWQADFAIKRVGKGLVLLTGGQVLSEFTLSASEVVPFIPDTAESLTDAILIQQNQQTKMIYKKNHIGIALAFTFQEHQPLTNLFLRKSVIQQPVQADLINLPERSLYNSQIQLIELGVESWSNHKGLNLNWEIVMGIGDIRFKTDITNDTKEENEIISLGGKLEIFYRLDFNRKWFSYTSWQGEIQSWKQAEENNPNIQIAQANTIHHIINAGIRFNF